MPIKIDVWSDFVCPACYLMETAIDKLRQEYAVVTKWHAYERGTTDAAGRTRSRRTTQTQPITPSMTAAHWPPTSASRLQKEASGRLALIAAKVAEAAGAGSKFRRAVMKAYWEDGQPIDDRRVLITLASGICLDARRFAEALDNPAYAAAVAADLALAHRKGIARVPSLVFNDDYIVQGAQPYEVLSDIVVEMQANSAASSGRRPPRG